MNAKEVVMKKVKILYSLFKRSDEGNNIEIAGRVHNLKTWPEEFEATRTGAKSFEYRINDRDFKPFEFLLLEEWNPETKPTAENPGINPGHYTGRKLICIVTYILYQGFGLAPNHCVMSIKVISEAV